MVIFFENCLSFSSQVAPCVNDTRVDFSWAVTCRDASALLKVESSASFQATKHQATLRVDRGVLTADLNFTFNVTASMNYDPTVQSSAGQIVRAMPSPLQPAIVGGQRKYVASVIFYNKIPQETTCLILQASTNMFCMITIEAQILLMSAVLLFFFYNNCLISRRRLANFYRQ